LRVCKSSYIRFIIDMWLVGFNIHSWFWLLLSNWWNWIIKARRLMPWSYIICRIIQNCNKLTDIQIFFLVRLFWLITIKQWSTLVISVILHSIQSIMIFNSFLLNQVHLLSNALLIGFRFICFIHEIISVEIHTLLFWWFIVFLARQMIL